MKICTKCNIEKNIDDYPKKSSFCKSCTKIYKREYYLNNRKEILEKGKDYVALHKDRIKEYKKSYYVDNIEHISDKFAIYYSDNREKIINYQKKYYAENIEHIRKWNLSYIKNKKKNSLVYRMSRVLNSLISNSLRRNGYKKKSRTFDIIGCGYDEFILHIESKFETWMSWNNRGLYNGELNYGWDIDHIIPVSSAKTEEEIIKLNHYTNLQPLCSKVNRDIKRHIIQ